MQYPRVLVVSNNCFSDTNSNGRTLGNFFEGWPKEKLAQFTLGIKDANFDLCNNYFCLTDRDVLHSVFFGGTKIGRQITNSNQIISNNNQSGKKVHKNALKMLLRQLVWSVGRWKNETLCQWINNFNPEIILLQSGDSGFMIQFALDIAKTKNIPLVFFNTEAYYFFRKNYLPNHWTDFVSYPFFHAWYKRIFRKAINYASMSIYGNKLLKDDYDREFHKSSCILYTSSEMDFSPKPMNLQNPVFSYIGNLGLNRPRGLADISQALSEIDSKYYLDVYGKASPEVENFFKKIPSIRFHGFVDYAEVQEIIKKSDILFHPELLNEGQEDLKYAFSTKIADSLASGHNFLLYASVDLACSRYIQDTGAAWFCSEQRNLKNIIEEILTNKQLREEKLEKAKILVSKNHRMQTNIESFRKILCNSINKI